MSHRLRVGAWCFLGVLITLGPMFVAEYLVRWVAVSYGTERLSDKAQHALGHIEARLTGTMTVLSRLVDGGAADCSETGIRLLSEAVFTNASLKEIGIYDQNDRLLCTNIGIARRGMRHPSSFEVTGDGIGLAMMPTRVPGYMSLGVHMRLKSDGGLVAMVENQDKASHFSPSKNEIRDNIRIALANGDTVIQFGSQINPTPDAGSDYVEVRKTSSWFPVSVTATTPREVLLAAFEKVNAFAKIGGGIMGVIMLALGGIAARRRLTGQNEIGDAILAGEFIPFYQPIVDARTGRISGCEVLVRWRKAGGELVPPDLFIPLAESTGQIIEITRQLMHQVSCDMAPICAVQPDFYTSLNLVAEHFTNNDIVSDIRQKFSAGAMTPANLVVEITERRPLLDMSRAKIVIESLQRLGVRVALDDAGTGHGGLAYIQSLGMDIIKIDRMFVEAIGTDAPSAPIVDALVDLGKQLQMTIIAEGVETESQFAYLQERGARYFQGYLFSPPMPIGAFVKFIGAFNPVAEQSPQTTANEPPAARPARALAGSA